MKKIKYTGHELLAEANLIDKINELVNKVNELESDLNKHKYGNTSSISPYDLSSRKRRINVYR